MSKSKHPPRHGMAVPYRPRKVRQFAGLVVAFVVTFVTILCLVWWPLPTAAAAVVVAAAGGVWVVKRP